MKFWMVVCADIDGTNFNMLERRGPRYMHDSREDAEREAERLAVANPASDFAVLASELTFAAAYVSLIASAL